MKQSYRVAFIGCGRRAQEHAKGVQADARCEVVAIADVKREAAEAFKSEFGFAGDIYTDYQTMLAEARPEVVIASLWTPLHLPVFQHCAEAGVQAVLSEKPMAPTWGECLAMARISEETGCRLTFCHQRRFSAGNKAIRSWIAEGRFGTIERMDLYSPPNLLDCGTHTVDQALSYLGDIPVKWVLGAVDASKPISYFNVSAEAMAVGTLVFANGVRAALQVGGPDMDIWGGVRVTGSEGFVLADWGGVISRAVVYSDPAWQPEAFPNEGKAEMEQVVSHALDCLASGEEAETSYQKALRANEILFALYESVRRHARIELPLLGVTDNPFITMLENGEFAGLLTAP